MYLFLKTTGIKYKDQTLPKFKKKIAYNLIESRFKPYLLELIAFDDNKIIYMFITDD